jgi:hypothetical protein
MYKQNDDNGQGYKRIAKCAGMGLLYTTLCLGTVLAGDGSNESGFIAPPRDRKKPPAPPRTSSSAESLLACCCCPVTPMSRTEAKKPPTPPTLVTKIKDENIPSEQYKTSIEYKIDQK